jgi:hypothetical protein
MSKFATVTALRHDNGVAVNALTPTELDDRIDANGMCVGATPDQINEIWFPSKTITNEMAREACAGCPVIAECLERALRREKADPRNGHWGIWGAASPDRRKAILRSQTRRAHAAKVRAELENTEVAS